MDLILNGQAHGSLASALIASNFDTSFLRPYLDENDVSRCVQVQNGKPVGVPVQNAATLRKDEWIMIDKAVAQTAQERLQAVADLRGRGLELALSNGLGHTVLQTQRASDVEGAAVSMDGLRESENDRQIFDIQNLPLPIIHKDFSFSARQLATSRNGYVPLDTSMVQLSTRKVIEEAERLLLGNSAIADLYTFGGGTIYGYTDFPQRITATVTTPVGNPTTFGTTLVTEILGFLDSLAAKKQYGPFMIYHGRNWNTYLDQDYSSAKGENTLRDRVKKIPGIADIKPLDFLGSGYQLIFVQMTSDVVREVIGMEVQAIQWESHGGMMVNFKVMAIMVPQLRADFNGNTGILHASVA